MNYLEKIIREKRKEVREMKKNETFSLLEKRPLFAQERPSFYDALNSRGPSIITEYKRKSPSKGLLNQNAEISLTVTSYEQAGASAVSILTDKHFDGRPEDISGTFQLINIPILQKDFIIDEIQVIEARANGASAILLIAAVLEEAEVRNLAKVAVNLGLDVMLELHDFDEYKGDFDVIKIIGINNRDLSTFSVDTHRSVELLSRIPSHLIKVSESGLSSVEQVLRLYETGFKAFLMGERFMKSNNPGDSARSFIREVNDRCGNINGIKQFNEN